jgi:hypothetical protein
VADDARRADRRRRDHDTGGTTELPPPRPRPPKARADPPRSRRPGLGLTIRRRRARRPLSCRPSGRSGRLPPGGGLFDMSIPRLPPC